MEHNTKVSTRTETLLDGNHTYIREEQVADCTADARRRDGGEGNGNNRIDEAKSKKEREEGENENIVVQGAVIGLVLT